MPGHTLMILTMIMTTKSHDLLHWQEQADKHNNSPWWWRLCPKRETFTFVFIPLIPVWWLGNKNSPTVTHECRKRRLKWVATLPLGYINTEAWSSGMGVGRRVQPYPVKKKIVEKPRRNSAGFWGGGQGLSWAVEPRKERRIHSTDDPS
jgi:hypothetical protein